MAFPNSVTSKLRMQSGVIGEVSHAGPKRARTAIVNSTVETNNVFGRAFTFDDMAVESVKAGGEGVFAGILINPKAYALTEWNGVFNGSIGEFLDMGEIYVEVEGAEAGQIGAVVNYNADGSLTLGEGTAIPNCVLERHLPSKETPNLCVIRLTN